MHLYPPNSLLYIANACLIYLYTGTLVSEKAYCAYLVLDKPLTVFKLSLFYILALLFNSYITAFNSFVDVSNKSIPYSGICENVN